jgi:HlyD family secretion protein
MIIMKFFKRWWGWALLLVALAGAGTWWALQPKDDGITYRTGKIERGSLQAAVSASGTVNPVLQVIVGTQVSGQVKELFADFNSAVKKGELIARIDPESFQYRLRQAQADLEASRAAVLNAQANVGAVAANASRARLDFENAQRDLNRKQDLLKQQFISQAEFETTRNLAGTLGESVKVALSQLEVARAQVASAQAGVRQREAALAQAQVDLERTEIRSPVDGVVIKRAVDVGQTVAASLQAPELFVIAQNLSDMQVEASIDEADISRVRPQQKATFTVDAFPGRSFEGQVKQVRKAAVSQQNVVTYTVVVPFANVATRANEQLLPGMTANVRIVTDNREAVLKVPNAALRVRIAGVEPPVEAAAASSAASGAASEAVAANDGERRRAAGGEGGGAASSRGGGQGAGGGPLRDFRDRVVSELKLSPEQTAAVDAVLAEARPRFADLRNLPEDSRAKSRERLLAEMRAQIGEKLTAEQRSQYQQLLAQSSGRGGSAASTRGRFYILDAKGKPRAVAVRLGVSDGVSTEVLLPPNSALAGELKEGTVVVVGVNNPPASGVGGRGGGAGASPRPPF